MYTLCFVAVVCGQVTKGPENVAVLVGSNVTLRCAGTDLGWDDHTTGHTITISFKASVVKPNKHILITEPTGTYDLIIKSTELNEGGRYRCKALNQLRSSIYAQVITFSGETLLLFLPWYNCF